MLKKFVSRLKNLFGDKPKKTVPQSVAPAKENKPVNPDRNKSYKNDKKSGTHPGRPPRKKETPEEYRLRKEQQAQNRQQKNKTEQKPLEAKRKEIKPPVKVKIQDDWDSSVFKVPIEDGKTRFHDFDGISKEILHAIYDLGFQYCTSVQAETLPKSLLGEDVTAQAQTGTGKTAAFLITIINFLLKNPIEKKRKHGTPRSLILAPTRELVLQIEKDANLLAKYANISILSLLGGIDYGKQIKTLKSSEIDILICTPGRLIDFMDKKLVDLAKVEILIIDEADRMLDMGFIPSVKKIVLSTPQKAKRQTMFFTATMTTDVKRLADSWTKQAFEITVKPEDIAVQAIDQITYITTVDEKPTLLYNIIMQKNLERVLIFVNRRDEAQKVKNTFEQYDISCALLTGDVEQVQRIKRLEKFREGKVRVLIATDVASRGIHVEGISHVINYNMPQDTEEYIHRIGRTGRAGATGVSINFADEEDSHELIKLEEFLGKKIECIFPEENLLIPIPEKHLVKKDSGQEDEKPKKKIYNRNKNRNFRKGPSKGGDNQKPNRPPKSGN